MPPSFPRAAALGLSWRNLTEEDVAFAGHVYALSRREEVAQTGWPEEAQRAFLEQQHQAQHAHYQRHYPTADWLMLEAGGTGIGRLYLEEGEDDIRLIDIALLPEQRGAGIGTALMEDLLDWARARGKSVSLHVEPYNPARRLYARLGFVSAGVQGVYERMDWRG